MTDSKSDDQPSEKAGPQKSELMQAYDRAVENAKLKQHEYLKSKMN